MPRRTSRSSRHRTHRRSHHPHFSDVADKTEVAPDDCLVDVGGLNTICSEKSDRPAWTASVVKDQTAPWRTTRVQ